MDRRRNCDHLQLLRQAYVAALSRALGPSFFVSLPRSGAPFFELVDTAYIRLLTLMMAVLAALGVLTSVLMVTRERVHDLGVFGPLRSNRTLSGDSQPPGAEISPTSVPAQPRRPGVVTGHGQHRSRNVRYAGSGVFGPLNRGETRNGLARDVFHGQRGQLRKRYQVGQENQLDTLGIMPSYLTRASF
jgi:hypothetical protein